ncbi:Tricalbin-2 [Cryomyces antarcticus]|uniref:Tricalbin-2 n=1 Tax=Cryomyces antarcticus TaxID=329879 RepID=A0ABR0LZP5_9PEZI|nr:Tricalbin-2 [Cryomyces antarcticus]
MDDGRTAGYDLPPPTTAGALPPPTSTTPGEPHAHNALVADDKYARVGWAPRFGNPGEKEDDGSTLLDHQTWLEGKLEDKFYGDWYHNAGVIIFACLSSWVVAVLGGGLGWIFIILAFCGTYYRTSIRRVRRNFRDDLNRQMAKARLETDHESLEWINSFLVKFWPIYAPVLCETIVNSVDQVLSTSTPAFLDSLRMKLFVLGTKPPRMEHVKTYPKSEDDIVLMDWKFSFTPNDVADLTALQIKNKQNPKIVLEVRIGKGMISKGLDVIVEDMAFSGIMRVKVKLQIPFPHVEKVEICFLGKPTIDYVCKPLGGDSLGFDINFIPGLQSFIQEQIHANLGPMMYDPNVFPIEIAKMLAGNPVDQAIGVLQITFHGAQGLKNPDKFSGTPDPYAVVSINGRQPLGRTKTVTGNANPRWNETVNIIITSLKDALTIQVYDFNEVRKDKELGTATFALDQLEQHSEFENQQLEVMANGRPRGIVQADIRFFPVLEGEKLEDGTVQPPPESMTGIAKFTVWGAKDLDGTKSMIGQLNPYAVLLLNGKEVAHSKKLKRTNNPVWPDATKELLITDRKSAKLGLVVKDDRDIAADPIIGTYQIKLNDMLELMNKGQEWYNLAGVKSGRVKMTLQWKPVSLKGALGGSGGYVTPIGVLRLHFQSARDLKNMETMGKSDPYIRVLLSGIEKGRTVTFKNNLNPEWDEVIYVPVHSTREKLLLEYTPTKLKLRDEAGRESQITVSLKYLPIEMQLDPSESMTNQGNLRVEVLDAADLPAADRNGFSDPYCKFSLNGKEIYKTKTQKKTLHPAWNEFFEVPVRSRTAAEFVVNVYDWDFGDKADFLGKAAINLNILEPFQAQEVTLGLDGKSGTIRLKMLFKPDYVTRSRQGSSTFSGTFAAPGKVIGAPVKGVGKGAVFVGGNMAKGASFIGRGFKRRKDGGAQEGSDESQAYQEREQAVTNGAAHAMPASNPNIIVDGAASQKELPRTPHNRSTSYGAASLSSTARSPIAANGAPEQGTASLTIVRASGYPAKANVQVKILSPAGKEHLKTKAAKSASGEVSWAEHAAETAQVRCAADALFRVSVRDHSTFHSDELGEGSFYVVDQGAGGEREVRAGPGSVLVRSRFLPDDRASEMGSVAEGGGSSPASRGGGKTRRSFLGTRRNRETTPNP